ncbi:hypothetical protein SCOCK_220007 [Actinacidiphila cocklensis]|uniref:Uncharacterized protein n=1 Tax=Actinacidiphila cocklensis TaxID=887465 RepID=A0A9W4GRI0_9ACTN|nr:hypothetical protein SCOCK_220007 [Actinacidiphila cocklensis]
MGTADGSGRDRVAAAGLGDAEDASDRPREADPLARGRGRAQRPVGAPVGTFDDFGHARRQGRPPQRDLGRPVVGGRVPAHRAAQAGPGDARRAAPGSVRGARHDPRGEGGAEPEGRQGPYRRGHHLRRPDASGRVRGLRQLLHLRPEDLRVPRLPRPEHHRQGQGQAPGRGHPALLPRQLGRRRQGQAAAVAGRRQRRTCGAAVAR